MQLWERVRAVEADVRDLGEAVAAFERGSRNPLVAVLAALGRYPDTAPLRNAYGQLLDDVEALSDALDDGHRDLRPAVQSGDEPPTEAWDDLRVDVFRRDEWTCRNCEHRGGRLGDADLHAHHVVPVGNGGRTATENLVTLCASCHRAAHGVEE